MNTGTRRPVTRVGWAVAAACVGWALMWPACGARAETPAAKTAPAVVTQMFATANDVRAAVMVDDALWLGTGGGVVKVTKDRVVTVYDVRDGLRSQDVYALAEAPGGALWVGTDRGVFTWKPAAAAAVVTREAAVSLAADGAGGVYVAQAALSVVHITAAGTAPLPARILGTTYALAVHKGALYLGTNYGIRVWDGRRLDTVRGTRPGEVALGLTVHGDDVLAHTPATTLTIRGNRVRTRVAASRAAGASRPRVELQTPWGALTAGPDGANLGGRPLDLGPAISNYITALATLHGDLFMGTFDGGLVRRGTDGTFTTFTEAHGLLDHRINTLAVWNDTLWIAHDRGVCRFSKGFQCWRSGEGPPPGHTSAFLPDGAGLFVGGSGGLARFEANQWRPIPLPVARVTSFAKAGTDTWVGTAEGLYRLGSTYAVLESRTAANRGLHDDWVTALTMHNGELWIGTYSDGIARIDGSGALHVVHTRAWINPNALTTFHNNVITGGLGEGLLTVTDRAITPDAAPLPSHDVTALLASGDTLWIGTRGGLVARTSDP